MSSFIFSCWFQVWGWGEQFPVQAQCAICRSGDRASIRILFSTDHGVQVLLLASLFQKTSLYRGHSYWWKLSKMNKAGQNIRKNISTWWEFNYIIFAIPSIILPLPSLLKMFSVLDPHQGQQGQAYFPSRPESVPCDLVRGHYTYHSHCLWSCIAYYHSDDLGGTCLHSFTGGSFPTFDKLGVLQVHLLLTDFWLHWNISLRLTKNSWLLLSKLCLNKPGPHYISLGYVELGIRTIHFGCSPKWGWWLEDKKRPPYKEVSPRRKAPSVGYANSTIVELLGIGAKNDSPCPQPKSQPGFIGQT